jgi:exonuclease SbcC
MRILQVRFKNLNSLVGEWQIDLTHPAFTSDGIFAITGPTGAGKTTILDAICLALYGRTPRLNKVTKSGNEIMSRQTGECFAEATFETLSGRYRCHWSQHRARKKPDGELQAPKHEIANADSGEIFESKIRGVADQIELTTGMDFERFTRSMLLAQGGFDTFLKAEADKRAPILEQITGTEIYSRISTRVHERQREEREKLNLLQAETAGIVILEPEQAQEIGQTLAAMLQEETNLATQSADTGKAIAWLNIINGLKKETASLADEASQLQIDIEAFKPEREKLGWALNAAALDGAYATLTATRKQQAEDSAALKTEDEALPGLESFAREQAETLKLAEQQTARTKEELKVAATTLQKVRSLDQKLADQKKAVSEGDAGCTKDAARIEADKKNRMEEHKKRSRAHEALDLVDGYLKTQSQDEWLISGLAAVEEQLGGLLSKQKEIVQKEVDQETASTALERAAKSLDDRQKQSGIRKLGLEEASKQIQRGKEALSQLLGDRLLREYRTEKETLLREMAFLNKIAELEDHRAKLEDGKPCPLCGAIEHPFAEGNDPVPDQTEQQIDALTNLISKAEDQEAAIKKLEVAESLASKNLTEAEKLESVAAHDKKVAESALVEVKDGLVKLRADFAERWQALATRLQPLGIVDIPETDISSLLDTLRARLNTWQTQVRKKVEVEKQIATIDSEVTRLDAVIETQSTALAEKRERLGVLKKEFAAARDERNALYGDQNPGDEERRLNKAISDAEGAEKQARERHHAHQQQWNTAKAHAGSLKKRIDQRELELRKLENEFAAALVPVGFSNEEQFLAARLPAARKTELAAKARDLDQRHTDLGAREKDRALRLAAEMARKVTDQSLEALKPRFQEQENTLKALRDSIAGLKHKLNEHEAATKRMKEKQTAIEAQKKECRRWENLHELIGSADGKKYRNFAQGLTFEMMIGHANRQLQKMTDRYLLARDDTQPLELNVVDNYQAGEIRSTKNLSGGESFIVSLSLALGLSHMASKNVRVDSLFLDEGFGTLDEDALDTALETLAGLQQEGKLIGVISHVPALKERISTQIQVTPQTGGRSQISGPGCGRFDAGELGLGAMPELT